MRRFTPLALKNLSYQLVRTLISISGIALAIVLMFMQLGFLGAVSDTAVSTYEKMPLDLVVRSSDYLHLFSPGSINVDAERLLRTNGNIAAIRPLSAGIGDYRKVLPDNQPYRSTSPSRAIAIMAIDPQRPGVITPEIIAKGPLLENPNCVLIDRLSRPQFAPIDGKQFGPRDIGANVEVNGTRYRIAETIKLGSGLASTGTIIVGQSGFDRLTDGRTRNRVSMLLVELNETADVWLVKEQLQADLDRGGYTDCRVLTREEVLRAERYRWEWETPVGFIFNTGVGLAVIVGAVICYMILASDVIAKLPEYATLKAMGYSNRFLGFTLLQQAIVLAVGAFLPAVVASMILYEITGALAGVPITMTWARVLAVGLLSVLMCAAAGIIALRKLTKAEPANLF